MRSAMLAPFATAMRELGVDPYHLVRKVGIPVGAMENGYEPISARSYRRLLEAAAEAGRCEELGLRIAEAFSLPMAGPVGLLARNAATLGAAIDDAARYLRYQTNCVEVITEPAGELVAVATIFPAFEAAACRPFVEVMVGALVQILRGLARPGWRPAQVTFAHPAPRDPAPYRQLFGSVSFGERLNAVLITQEDLDMPIVGADPQMAREVARFIENNAAPMAALSQTAQVTEMIKRLLPEGRSSIDEVAQHLGVTTRTVQRRLSYEGKSFSALTEAARKDLVAKHLHSPNVRLSSIARRLGFSSASAFSRWFHKVYGVQPRRFQRAF